MDSLGIIFTLIGGVVSVGTIIVWFNQSRKNIAEKISWKQVERGVLQLKEQLIKNNYYPTLIVGIGRGGSIIGALLSGTLGNTPIIVIDRVYQWEKQERKEAFCEDIKVSKNIDRVLLVSGELHSGNTARKYSAYFKSMGAKQIRMMSFVKKKYPTFNPDFFYLEMAKSDFRLPWMLTKNYKRDSKKNYNER